LSEISDEGNGDDPIEPSFGKCLEISLDWFMQFIKVLDDTDDHECKSGNDAKCHILLIIHNWYLQLDEWYQVGEKTDSVHHIKHHDNQTDMK